MSLSLEHIDACIPITGLEVLSVKNARLILQAQGTFSCLIDEKSGRLLAKLRTFKGYNVHGFLILNQTPNDEGAEYVQVIAWGEYSVRLIDLLYINGKVNEDWEASMTAASAEYLAPDWLLAGCTDGSGNAYLVTAHNALLSLRVVAGSSSTYKSSIRLRQLVTGVKSILYSANTVALSTSHILVAAGTVFGEVIVWSCFLDSLDPSSAQGSIHHFFTGHEGSIFGVRISSEIPFLHGDHPGRLLASCSDDRTVRIWDISDCERRSRDDPSAYLTDGFELRSTGFGATGAKNHKVGSESSVAKAFGHVSRIWGVRFLPLLDGEWGRLSLVSHGEDATCLLWNLTWSWPSQGSGFQLCHVSSFNNHAGKNIFSLDMYRAGSETIIHTGGADGAIKTLRIDEANNESVVGTSARKSDIPKKGRGFYRAYAFVSSDCFIATSVQGEVQLGRIVFQGDETKLSIVKETLSIEDDLRSFSSVTGFPNRGLALLGNSQGLIRLYDHRTKSLSTVTQTDQRIPALFAADTGMDASPTSTSHTFSFVAYYANIDRANLFRISASDTTEISVDNIAVDLPQHFEINCASLIYNNQYLALGSRHGALAVYHVSNTGQPLQPLTFIRRVHDEHGIAGVNKILPFGSRNPGTDASDEYFMTCGRDGSYCVHEVEVDDSEKSINLRTIHRSSANIHNVAGAYFDRKTQDLMLYGSRNKIFVLWNESAQTELASIDCGGSRGHWDFHPGDESSDTGVFLWIQSATLNARRLHTRRTRPLRAGAHGREIKTVEVFNAANMENTVLATGSEDTTIRIFKPSPLHAESVWGAFKCLRVIKHNTSLQQVSFSEDSRFLFASSGLEGFYVWRIRSIPVFGFAARLLALSPKDEENSDLRVTSFDVVEVEEQGPEQSFLFCLTLSNSTIKIFDFSTSGDDGHFTLLARAKYTSNCLTQARFLLKNLSLSLITTSTDGHFALWNLTPALERYYSISSTLSVKQPPKSTSITPENITCESRYQAHSNSIKSMEVIHISDAVSLVAAGGDDNGLSLSLLNTIFTAPEANANVTTISIPDAHAASVTAVKVLETRYPNPGSANVTTTISIASSGNDHRVKIWSVEVNLEKDGPERIQVKNTVDEYSNIADIAALDVVRFHSGDVTSLGNDSKLLICGVGMELLDISLAPTGGVGS